jgi:transcriptional regulator with XRE-family HTH domain
MEYKSGNIYRKYRFAAGFHNLRTAAERLHVSYDTLLNYENDKTKPNEDMVFLMAEIYGDQMLIVENFEKSRTGKFLSEKFGLDYQVGELSQAALGVISGCKHVDLGRLADITWDGQITPDEFRDADTLEIKLNFLVRQGMQLLWTLKEVKRLRTKEIKITPEKTKTALQSGSQRNLEYAV